MAARKPTNKCLLCGVNDATKTASHIIPSFLLNSVIGKRYKEHSFLIDTSTATVDEYFGRDVSPSTEIKEHHHAPDYYFCPKCESKLGDLENKVSPHLTGKLRDPKFFANYRSKSAGGLTFKELLKVDSDDFNVLFLSIIWRQALQRKIADDVSVVSDNDLEILRRIVNSYLWEDEATYQSLCDQFALMVISADAFDNATANMTSALHHRERPYIFLINEFWVFAYPARDFAESKNQPRTYFHIPPSLQNLNFPGVTPNIVLLPKTEWFEILKQWNEDIAPIFLNRLNQKIANANAVVKQVKKRNKKKIKAARRASRASKRKNRK